MNDTEQPTSPDVYYFNGDAAVYTGISEWIHVANCYQCRLVEGHRKGELIWTYQPPSTNH